MRVGWFLRTAACVLALASLVLLAPGCQSKKSDGGGGGGNVPAKFRELCAGTDIAASSRAATLQYDNGQRFSSSRSLIDGDIEVVNFIPEGPFWLKKLHFHFLGDAGTVILHVYGDLGRSWPDEKKDLIEPITLDVPKDAGWGVVDVSDKQLLFHPSEHFWIGYEHTAEAPLLSIDSGVAADDGTPSDPEHSKQKNQKLIEEWRAQGLAYVWDLALTNSYLIRAEGSYFCEWAARGMTDVTAQAGLSAGSHMRVGWSDLNNDGWDDIVLTTSGYQAESTKVFLNDGDGTFRDATAASGLSGHYQALNLMGDLDNDGNQDVYAGVYVPQDVVSSDPAGTGTVPCDGCTLSTAKRGALLARIGEAGTPFVAGTSYGGATPDAGAVQLIVNDDNYADNAGQYAATVTVTPPGAKDGVPVTVPGDNASWTDSGVAAVAGGTLAVTAEGTVVLSRTDTGARSKVFLGHGDGTFTEVESTGVDVDATTAAAAFGDYDQDGKLDLYVGNWLLQYPDPASFTDILFHGNGDGTFADVTDAAGMTPEAQGGGMPCYGVVWGDYNNDGLPDIYVGNYGREDNFLWRNNGDGTFTNVATALGADHSHSPSSRGGGNTFGVDFGDFDNDGNLDVYATNIAHPRYLPTTDISDLFHNLGEAGGYAFEDVRELVGIAYDEGEIEASFVDVNNDGLLDLSLSDLYPLHYFRLYRQNEDHSFTDITYMAGIWVTPATNHAWADYDHDGRPDLLISENSSPIKNHLFHNEMGAGNHWLMVRLVGTDSNRDAVGARVTVTTGTRTQLREVKGGKGHFDSQPSLVQHFGLGEYDFIDSLTVRWPSGHVDTYTSLGDVDHYIKITEGAPNPEVEE